MKNIFKTILCMMLVFITSFSVLSIAVSAKTVVDLPKTENVRIEMYPDGVNVIWEPNETNLKYQHIVYRSDSGKAGTWKKLATVEKYNFYYIDKTAVMGKKYYYTVKSYLKEEGTSAVHVSEMSGKHKATRTPHRGELISTTNCGKGVLVKWPGLPTYNDGYIIYRSTENKAGTWTKIATIKNGETGTYTDNKVSVGETYYYSIKYYKTANGKNICGKASSSKKCTIKDVAVPQNLKVEYEGEKVKICFDKVPATRGYMIYRSETGKAGTWTKIIVTTTNSKTEFYDETAKLGTKYYYTVKSYKNLNGKNIYSGNTKVVSIGPAIVALNNRVINLEGESNQLTLSFANPGIKNDDLKVFVNGDLFTYNVYNDVEKSKEFFEDKPVCVEQWYNTDAGIEFDVIRTGTGKATFKVQYARDESIHDEYIINCTESEFEKDTTEAETKINSAVHKVKEAKKLLEDGYDETTKDTNVVEHKNSVAVKELILSADKDISEAKQLVEKHKEEYSGKLDYQDLIFKIEKYESMFLIAKNKFEGDFNKEKTLESTIKYFDTIINYK